MFSNVSSFGNSNIGFLSCNGNSCDMVVGFFFIIGYNNNGVLLYFFINFVSMSVYFFYNDLVICVCCNVVVKFVDII